MLRVENEKSCEAIFISPCLADATVCATVAFVAKNVVRVPRVVSQQSSVLFYTRKIYSFPSFEHVKEQRCGIYMKLALEA